MLLIFLFFLLTTKKNSIQNRILHADEQHDAAYAQRMKRWANDEGAANRNYHGGGAGAGGGRGSGVRTGTGMGMGVAAGAAVTGHRARAARTSAPPVKKKPNNNNNNNAAAVTASGASTTATAATAPPVRKTVSALSAVADRRGRFGA